jgi:homoserine O-succinyltransferase
MITGRLQFSATQPPKRAPLRIGLLNNMPDAALHATERQFARLLGAAAGPHDVSLRHYSLPEVSRGEHTRTYMATLYGEFDEMFDQGLDGLIVTGAEPRTEKLVDEPYWARLTQVIDWAETNLHASYWSCLAAHAAVQHLDGIERVRLPAKCSGVFESEIVGDDPLLAHLRGPVRTPHSRLNGLDEQALSQQGYTILTRSPEAGVDTFVRRDHSLMVFCQGHPEYDAETLMREYCRDAGRFLCGKREARPDIPAHYLNARLRRALATTARRKPDPALMARYNAIAAVARPRQVWRASAVGLFRGWLGQIAAAKAAAARAARKGARPALASLPA